MIAQTVFVLLVVLTLGQGKVVDSEEKIQDERDKINSENTGFVTTDDLVVSSTPGAVQKITETALYKYVHKPDQHYSWRDTGQRVNGTSKFCTINCGFVGYVLNMTSQGWLTAGGRKFEMY